MGGDAISVACCRAHSIVPILVAHRAIDERRVIESVVFKTTPNIVCIVNFDRLVARDGLAGWIRCLSPDIATRNVGLWPLAPKVKAPSSDRKLSKYDKMEYRGAKFSHVSLDGIGVPAPVTNRHIVVEDPRPATAVSGHITIDINTGRQRLWLDGVDTILARPCQRASH